MLDPNNTNSTDPLDTDYENGDEALSDEDEDVYSTPKIKKHWAEKKLFWLISVAIIVAVFVGYTYWNNSQQVEEPEEPEETTIEETVIEEVVYHELTQQEFDTIISQLFMRNESGDIISITQYLNSRLDLLNDRLDNLVEE